MQTRSGLARRDTEDGAVELYYEDLGDPNDPAVLLIMGLGAQLPMWPDGFCEQLLDAVWGSDVYVETRTVDVHIGRLRRALNTEDNNDPIRTVRSAGYALDV